MRYSSCRRICLYRHGNLLFSFAYCKYYFLISSFCIPRPPGNTLGDNSSLLYFIIVFVNPSYRKGSVLLSQLSGCRFLFHPREAAHFIFLYTSSKRHCRHRSFCRLYHSRRCLRYCFISPDPRNQKRRRPLVRYCSSRENPRLNTTVMLLVILIFSLRAAPKSIKTSRSSRVSRILSGLISR